MTHTPEWPVDVLWSFIWKRNQTEQNIFLLMSKNILKIVRVWLSHNSMVSILMVNKKDILTNCAVRTKIKNKNKITANQVQATLGLAYFDQSGPKNSQ